MEPQLYEPVDLEAMVVAGAHRTIFTWEDLNNPSDSKKIPVENRITAFMVAEVFDEVKYFAAHNKGVSIIDPSTEKEFLIPYTSERSIRKIELHEFDKPYLFIATGEELFAVDMNKPTKTALRFRGFKGDLNSFCVNNFGDTPYVFVAADGVYQYALDNEEPIEIYEVNGQKKIITDVDANGRVLRGANISKLVEWNLRIPGEQVKTLAGISTPSISALEVATIHASEFIFAASINPQIFRRFFDGEKHSTYRKLPDNRNGTGNISVEHQRGKHFLLASDRNSVGPTPHAEILIWDITDPDKPLQRLRTIQNSGIKGFGVLKYE